MSSFEVHRQGGTPSPGSHVQPSPPPGTDVDGATPAPPRARLMPVGPRTVYVYWDCREVYTDRWEISATRSRDGAILHRFSVPGFGGEAWVNVPPDTHGEVALSADTSDGPRIVATLPFATPPVMAAGYGATRWVRFGGTAGFVDASAPDGRPTDLVDTAFGSSGQYGERN